jgi:hypothetical protein
LPLRQLFIHCFSSFLFGIALNAFHITNDNVFDSLLNAPVYKFSADFMKSIS